MPFLASKDTPDSTSYQAMLARSIPGGEVVDSRTIYGAGAILRVGIDARPAELLAPRLFDSTMEAALVASIDSVGSPPELRIADDRLEMEWVGWPADEATVRAILTLVQELARRVTTGTSELAGADGTLAMHPDVVVLRDLRATRALIGRRVLAVIGVVLFVMIALGLFASLTYAPG